MLKKTVCTLPYLHTYSSAIAFSMRPAAVRHSKAIELSEAIAEAYILNPIMAIITDNYEHARHYHLS